MARITRRDKVQFSEFCRYATDTQLANIEQKERDAGRLAYAKIARAEAERRASE